MLIESVEKSVQGIRQTALQQDRDRDLNGLKLIVGKLVTVDETDERAFWLPLEDAHIVPAIDEGESSQDGATLKTYWMIIQKTQERPCRTFVDPHAGLGTGLDLRLNQLGLGTV
ncbi:uncharacterized protein DSM5745_09363 [Aspergillus mulundensis]|uniref:Uncharacterized protein n=1 Tax=Aspergillus mulundensis TaxID=1810919 RepID=A0A3D8R0C8_9EURO|nr:hypothetical protein DSM5745_09363 [Aspergillus mulundensis]RDW67497.1 hypothetical protein DSM5745_09363 [Aspergillus mulundensis]